MDFIEPCFGIGHNLSLICQMTSEDIKHQLIIIIQQVSKHHLLGVTVDGQLKWQTHINNICRTVSINIFLLSKLSQIVSQKSKLAVFFSGSLAWNSLAHHLRYHMELKTFKRKAFQAPWILLYTFFLLSLFFSLVSQLDTKCIECCYCFPFLALVMF